MGLPVRPGYPWLAWFRQHRLWLVMERKHESILPGQKPDNKGFSAGAAWGLCGAGIVAGFLMGRAGQDAGIRGSSTDDGESAGIAKACTAISNAIRSESTADGIKDAVFGQCGGRYR